MDSSIDRQSVDSLAASDAHPVTFRRMFMLAVPEWPLLTLGTVALMVSASIQLIYPMAVSWMMDEVVEHGDLDRLNVLAIVLVVLFFIQGVFAMLRSWLYTVAGERIVARLREALYNAVIRQDIGFFDTARTGELTNRLAADTTVLQNTVTVNISMGLRFSIMGVGSLLMMLYMSPSLTGMAMLVVPIVAIGAAVYGRIVRKLSKKVQDSLADATQVAEETIQGVRTVRAFSREDMEVARYGRAVQTSFRLAAKRALATGVFSGITAFGGFSAIALVVWYGGRMVIADQLTAGSLTAFLLYTVSVAVALGAVSNLYGDFMRAAGSSKRVFQLMDMDAPLEKREGNPVLAVRGDVRLEDVYFTYPARPDEPVLNGIDLHLLPGEMVALVGPSGAGKSTIASLLTRFYDVDSGRILVDGEDVLGLRTSDLRQHVGIVAQEPILFATSIVENIRYGRPEASDEQVHDAARLANAATFVETFEHGFDTQVGERGVRLSGGQKQRIAIARALLKNPAILVLDEATSALDAESEHLVQEALDRLMEGRTTLVIAHRLSTVRGADRVVVLDGGRVAEEGSHDELLQREHGLYRKLVERQFAM
ncbi:MAG: ABC transporter fused permease/ATP-binding protein [Kiritimatiellia bacterium]|jgi:ABC transporter fused permease/ATP-binding protein